MVAVLAPLREALCPKPFIASIVLLALILAAVGGGGLIPARRLRSRLDIHPYRSAPTAPSLPWQCPRYADGATGGRSTCFLFWRSWRHRSRCGARRRGGGAPRGSGIDPDAAAPPDTERPSCRPARSSGFVSSAGLPLLALQERDGPRPGRRGWVPSTAADECALQMQPSALPVYPRAGNQRPHRHRLCRKARQASRQACGGWDPSPPSQPCRHWGGCGLTPARTVRVFLLCPATPVIPYRTRT